MQEDNDKCPIGLRFVELRDFLFHVKAGCEPDETPQEIPKYLKPAGTDNERTYTYREILEHLASAKCECCAARVDALNATEPYLLGQPSPPLEIFSSRELATRDQPPAPKVS